MRPASSRESDEDGSAISIVVVDDHEVVRSGLRMLLDGQPDFDVIGTASDGREAVRVVGELHPDVVVMDIAMPGLNGIDAADRMRGATPESRVVLLSAHGDDAYINRVIAKGDLGFVLKRSDLSHLFRAIREAAAGRTYFSPVFRRRLSAGRPSARRGVKSPGAHLPSLSPREIEVLQLIAEGTGNKRTAFELGICVKTVEKHRQSVMRKLDLHDVTALVRYAVSTGMIECFHPDSID